MRLSCEESVFKIEIKCNKSSIRSKIYLNFLAFIMVYMSHIPQIIIDVSKF